MTTEQTLRETFIATATDAIHGDRASRGLSCVSLLHPCRDYAIQLYGMVTALNGPIEGIVAAMLAVNCRTNHRDHGPVCDPLNKADLVAALFRAIAVESLGGAKVSETFGKVLLDDLSRCVRCGRTGVSGSHTAGGGWHAVDPGKRRLEVPRLTIEGAQS